MCVDGTLGVDNATQSVLQTVTQDINIVSQKHGPVTAYLGLSLAVVRNHPVPHHPYYIVWLLGMTQLRQSRMS